MSIEEVNEELDISLPQGEFDTIAGFVLDVLGHIPNEGEQFEYENLMLEIIEMKDFKIESIKVTKTQAMEGNAPVESDNRQARGNTPE